MCTASNSTVESTGIASHLEMMVELLCAEDEEGNPQDPGTMVSTAVFLVCCYSNRVSELCELGIGWMR